MDIKYRLFLFLLVFSAMTAAYFAVFIRRADVGYEVIKSAVPIRAVDAPAPTATPMPVPASRLVMTSQPSPDGRREVRMKKQSNSDGSFTYTFTTTGGADGSEKQLYTATLSGSVEMSLPFNAWSPDDKYVFLQKSDGNILLFKADAPEITAGEAYWDVRAVFTAAGRTDTYLETTGWASDSLLIINTTAADGQRGSSYWLEVPSKAVLQLSQRY